MGVLEEAQNGQRSPEQVGAGAPSSKVSESTFSFRQGLALRDEIRRSGFTGILASLDVRQAHPIVPSDKMKLVLTRSALLLHCRRSVVFVVRAGGFSDIFCGIR
jgi:hypothetical protein